ncbi:unnamed protein product [Didymodactylos carnosus]|uniref:PDZ and LIM domain protein Zasp n=1 Tax=Didymodactylos carnosus TaxID=1234261 RepID=A0A813P5F8_9BILA|nr:unnamed protein product [Didymodactylos carnosus]CAF0779411.1 unnamed protein product [Didymodactylos carnosus]CAF3526742.1 unnamed protein product [Didymodactylos carnosus]CAF3560821.1 unnamed protein product [Didymodactylos carnosus]
MPSYTVLNVKLQRESPSTPWGFRMTGGKEFNSPLQIQRINPGSLAERCGIQPDDYIIKISSISTEHLKHQDAQDCIMRQQNNLELTLQRGAAPDHNDYSSNLEFPPHQLMTSNQPKSSYHQQQPQKVIPQIGLPVANNRALLTQAHNTPIGLYSADTVTDTLNRTLKSNGTKNVEDLQSKYLNCEDKIRNEARQGPSFRALLKGLDDGTVSNVIKNDTTMSQPSNYWEQKTLTVPNGFRPIQTMRNESNINDKFQNLNMSSPYKVEEPSSYNEFKASTTKAMSKPSPMNNNVSSSQPSFASNSPRSFSNKPTTRQTPASTNQYQPHTPSTPSFNVDINPVNKGNRVLMKGAKGSALLTKEIPSGSQIPVCSSCGTVIRGPFITAIGRTWCVDHFRCSNCGTNLAECGFVEEHGKLYCEADFEKFLAPKCHKCNQAILKECCHALEKSWHPECFVCTSCKKLIGTGSFHVEEGQPYCLEDYRRMFQSKCSSCDFAIEAGDKYLEVESLGGTYHVECFNCSMCQTSLEGQPFVVKNNKPYCRIHGH